LWAKPLLSLLTIQVTYLTVLPPTTVTPLAKRDLREHPQQNFNIVVLHQFFLKLAEIEIKGYLILAYALEKF